MEMKRHILVPAALAAILVLGACGSEPDSVADTSDSADSSVDDSSSTDGADDLIPPRPIEVAAGTSGGGSARLDGALAADAEIAATDQMFMPYTDIEYVVGDGLPALPTNDIGYLYQAGTKVDAAEVAALAAALAVPGEPVEIDDGAGGSWRVGPDDGSAASLWVSSDAQLSWNYNGPWAEMSATEGCAVSVDSDGNESSECPEPTPPTGVPTADDAESRARELMVAIGLEPDAFAFEVYADEWFASVNATETLDGEFSARTVSFGFGAEGVMQYAGGQFAVPQRVGPYPLIDLDEAVDRLDEQSVGFGGGMMLDTPAIGVTESPPVDIAEGAVSEVATVEGDKEGEGFVPIETVPEPTFPEQTAPPSVPVETLPPETLPPETLPVETLPPETVPATTPPATAPVDTVPAPTTPPESVPVETVPEPTFPPETVPVEPETMVVTLVDVEADVWWAWDIDGSVWLLPAYRFIDTDGGWHVVPAVTDEFLIEVEPPMPIESMPLPEPMPVEPDGGIGGDTGGQSEPGSSGAIDVVDPDAILGESDLKALVGGTLDDFTVEAEALGFTVRVVERDGEPLPSTMDYREDRINVAVKGDDIVVRVVNFG